MPLPEIPPLATARLLVRPVAAGDLPDLLAVNGDDAVTRFLPYDTWRGAADGEAWLARGEALAAAGGSRQLVLVLREAGLVIGTLLLFRHDEGSRRAEIGYALGRAHQGRGLMGEAVAALVAHAFGPLGLRRLEAEVNPDNTPSARLLQRQGFQREGRLRQRWEAKGLVYDTEIFGLLAGEAAAAGAPR